MKKRDGKIEVLVPLYFFLFFLVILVYVLQMYKVRVVSAMAEDALTASNLAAAVVDVEEYGVTGNLIIPSPGNAFVMYQNALKTNMNLDNNWKSIRDDSPISGQVEVLDFIVYNVRGTNVEIHSFGRNPYSSVEVNGLGIVCAPDGKVIENTSIYSHITFPVETAFDVTVQAEKEELVDITD